MVYCLYQLQQDGNLYTCLSVCLSECKGMQCSLVSDINDKLFCLEQ